MKSDNQNSYQSPEVKVMEIFTRSLICDSPGAEGQDPEGHGTLGD